MEQITRFRVEAQGDDRDELGERMSEAVSLISKALRKEGDRGHWECTDMVISAVKTYSSRAREVVATGMYKGRMVMKFVEYDGEG